MGKIIYNDMCYVLLKMPNQVHAIAKERHSLIWYPEVAMTLLDCVQYKRYVKSVVTENPWIISCYPRDNVRVWSEGEWTYPRNETYGASINHIMMTLLKIHQTIPSAVLDGGEQIHKLIKEINYENSYSS